MPNISSTDASRSFASMLDAVEHRGEHFTVIRRGRPVARIEPVQHGDGARVKSLLKQHRVDRYWSHELDELRGLLELERRQ